MIRTTSLATLAIVLAVPVAQAQQQRTAGQQQGSAGQQRTAGQQRGGGQQGTAGQAAVNDSLFAAAAAAGGLTEVEISQIGVQRATDPELKQFSQRMIDEHTRMNQELMTLAAQKQVALPRTLDPRAQFCAQSLAGLSGEEFDRCYAKAQLVAHLDSVETFEAEAQRGMDADMRALASKSLPHIKEHLNMIKPIAMRFDKDKSSSERTER